MGFQENLKTDVANISIPLLLILYQEAATDPWGVHVDRVEIKDVR